MLEHLHRAGPPSVALKLVLAGIVGRQATSQHLVVIDGPPAGAMESNGGVDVLGDGVGRSAAHRAERLGPHQCAGAAPEGGIPSVLAGLEEPIEERLLMEWLTVGDPASVLEAGDVVEVLRRLDERDALVGEVAERGAQEVGSRDMVGIEEGQDLGVDHAKRVIHVARLGVLMGRTCEIARAQRGRELGDLRPLTVVEHPGLVLRLERDRRRDRRHQDLGALVVGRDQHRDTRERGPARDGGAGRRRPTG